MTGPEHYREAERLLRILTKPVEHGAVIDASMNPNVAAAAQAHAALSLAAAVALTANSGTDLQQWMKAAGDAR